MRREQQLGELRRDTCWDVLIIGGGATGLGIALDSVSRGYTTALVEQGDFANGTSSRSTKIIHGGLRYLQQGNFKLIAEGLHERKLLLQNCPELVLPLGYLLPAYSRFDELKFGAALLLYQLLGRTFAGYERIGSNDLRERIPGLRDENVRAVLRYVDAQFDDAGLALALVVESQRHGASLLNYVRADSLIYERGRVVGARAIDQETNESFEIRARVVLNATGPSVDLIESQNSEAQSIRLSQGSHLILDESFFPGKDALIAPLPDNGRVLFVIPWMGSVLVGTTDVELESLPENPVPSAQEIDSLLETAAAYLRRAPTRADVRSMFAGIRPLARRSNLPSARASREHSITASASGLITISGGKWTTYRKMAEDAVDLAARVAGLPQRECVTSTLSLATNRDKHVEEIMWEDPALVAPLHHLRPETKAHVVAAARFEMARTVTDVLGRRLRVLFLDARAALEMAPVTATLLAAELGRSESWIQSELRRFTQTAHTFLPPTE